MVSIVKPTQLYTALMGFWACVDDPVPDDRDCRLSHRLCSGNILENPYPRALGASDCAECLVDAHIFWCKKPGRCNDLYWPSLGHDLCSDLDDTSGR